MSPLFNFYKFHENMVKTGYISNPGGLKKCKLKIPKIVTIHKGVRMPVDSEIRVIDGTVGMSYEALFLLFSFSGHEARLFIFLIAYCKDRKDNSFKWNKVLAEEYRELFRLSSGKDVKFETIRQALVKLNKVKAIRKIANGYYMMNPLYTARPSKYHAENLFKHFLQETAKRGDSIEDALYMDADE